MGSVQVLAADLLNLDKLPEFNALVLSSGGTELSIWLRC